MDCAAQINHPDESGKKNLRIIVYDDFSASDTVYSIADILDWLYDCMSEGSKY